MGEDAVSPARFPDWTETSQFRDFANEVRSRTGGIPIGYKLIRPAYREGHRRGARYRLRLHHSRWPRRRHRRCAADFPRQYLGADDPRARPRQRHLDAAGRRDVTLVITGGLRTPADFAKALALGADAVAIANAAIQAVGCIGMRACHTNNCPVGIATQKPNLVARLKIEQSAQQLARFLETSVHLMKILARACGHSHVKDFSTDDLVTWKHDMARLSGVPYAGVGLN